MLWIWKIASGFCRRPGRDGKTYITGVLGSVGVTFLLCPDSWGVGGDGGWGLWFSGGPAPAVSGFRVSLDWGAKRPGWMGAKRPWYPGAGESERMVAGVPVCVRGLGRGCPCAWGAEGLEGGELGFQDVGGYWDMGWGVVESSGAGRPRGFGIRVLVVPWVWGIVYPDAPGWDARCPWRL